MKKAHIEAIRAWRRLTVNRSEPGPKYCFRCGAVNAPTAPYCGACGALLDY